MLKEKARRHTLINPTIDKSSTNLFLGKKTLHVCGSESFGFVLVWALFWFLFFPRGCLIVCLLLFWFGWVCFIPGTENPGAWTDLEVLNLCSLRAQIIGMAT